MYPRKGDFLVDSILICIGGKFNRFDYLIGKCRDHRNIVLQSDIRHPRNSYQLSKFGNAATQEFYVFNIPQLLQQQTS